MQITINIPDTMPSDKIGHIVSDLKKTLSTEGIPMEIRDDNRPEMDSWNQLDIEAIASDAGVEDLAKNHDHYLYGLPKRL
jgi:hypothetical protein